MYFVKTPALFKYLFPNGTWKVDTGIKKLYLTFDDGPIPQITPWILDLLAAHDATATFFCVGENAERYPEIIDRIVREGHSIGSHTHNHLNGWNEENNAYFLNVRKAAKLVGSNLFRPPYGKLKPRQAHFLSKHYKIVMWDILSGDFDASLKLDEVYHNIIDHIEPGSIIVMHDSLKTMHHVQFTLPRLLQFATKQGYVFEGIEGDFSLRSRIPRKDNVITL